MYKPIFADIAWPYATSSTVECDPGAASLPQGHGCYRQTNCRKPSPWSYGTPPFDPEGKKKGIRRFGVQVHTGKTTGETCRTGKLSLFEGTTPSRPTLARFQLGAGIAKHRSRKFRCPLVHLRRRIAQQTQTLGSYRRCLMLPTCTSAAIKCTLRGSELWQHDRGNFVVTGAIVLSP